MLRRRSIIGGLALCAIITLVIIKIERQQLVSHRREREAHFVTVYFLASNSEWKADLDGPKNYAELLSPIGGGEAGIGRPFVDGLDYRPTGDSFVLEEPKAHRVSFFRSDRLVATDQRWPRWEATGEYARKFPDQKVPPLGYE